MLVVFSIFRVAFVSRTVTNDLLHMRHPLTKGGNYGKHPEGDERCLVNTKHFEHVVHLLVGDVLYGGNTVQGYSCFLENVRLLDISWVSYKIQELVYNEMYSFSVPSVSVLLQSVRHLRVNSKGLNVKIKTFRVVSRYIGAKRYN